MSNAGDDNRMKVWIDVPSKADPLDAALAVELIYRHASEKWLTRSLGFKPDGGYQCLSLVRIVPDWEAGECYATEVARALGFDWKKTDERFPAMDLLMYVRNRVEAKRHNLEFDDAFGLAALDDRFRSAAAECGGLQEEWDQCLRYILQRMLEERASA